VVTRIFDPAQWQRPVSDMIWRGLGLVEVRVQQKEPVGLGNCDELHAKRVKHYEVRDTLVGLQNAFAAFSGLCPARSNGA